MTRKPGALGPDAGGKTVGLIAAGLAQGPCPPEPPFLTPLEALDTKITLFRSDWVACGDGVLYRPVLLGDNCFVRIDAGALMVYCATAARTDSARRKLVRRRLRAMGIHSFTIDGVTYASSTAFPPKYSGITRCWVWELTLLAPLEGHVNVIHATKDAHGRN